MRQSSRTSAPDAGGSTRSAGATGPRCCRHSFSTRFVHRGNRSCGSVGRVGSCRVLAGSPGRSGRSWRGTAPGGRELDAQRLARYEPTFQQVAILAVGHQAALLTLKAELHAGKLPSPSLNRRRSSAAVRSRAWSEARMSGWCTNGADRSSHVGSSPSRALHLHLNRVGTYVRDQRRDAPHSA
jgi:hypothetical protein